MDRPSGAGRDSLRYGRHGGLGSCLHGASDAGELGEFGYLVHLFGHVRRFVGSFRLQAAMMSDAVKA